MAARPFKSREEVAEVEGMSLGMIDDFAVAVPNSTSLHVERVWVTGQANEALLGDNAG